MLLTLSRSLGSIRTTCAVIASRPYSCQASNQWTIAKTPFPRHRSLSTSDCLFAKRRKGFFSSNASTRGPQGEKEPAEQQLQQGQEQGKKRKAKIVPGGKTSLRRVAVEAQRSKEGHELKKSASPGLQTATKTVTAICAAENYDIAQVSHLLQTRGHQLDPYGTGLYPQVVHIEVPVDVQQSDTVAANASLGDIFIFPSGTVVSWAVPDEILSGFLSDVVSPAAVHPHPATTEEEDLEYMTDPQREGSSIKGDMILLGTKQKTAYSDLESSSLTATSRSDPSMYHDEVRTIDTVLAKIAFSSGLARSTKLAVLETLTSNYFVSTRSIPGLLARGGRLPFTRKFILQKTGELLNIRAQLNLYSELTDSLPDLFWDTRPALGLESYYDQVGHALDTNIRIKTLNQKMDYAQEIASVLRQQLSEQHGVRLEWIIILLITIEVLFGIHHLYKEYGDSHEKSRS